MDTLDQTVDNHTLATKQYAKIMEQRLANMVIAVVYVHLCTMANIANINNNAKLGLAEDGVVRMDILLVMGMTAPVNAIMVILAHSANRKTRLNIVRLVLLTGLAITVEHLSVDMEIAHVYVLMGIQVNGVINVIKTAVRTMELLFSLGMEHVHANVILVIKASIVGIRHVLTDHSITPA